MAGVWFARWVVKWFGSQQKDGFLDRLQFVYRLSVSEDYRPSNDLVTVNDELERRW
jgi:hypothetical protein